MSDMIECDGCKKRMYADSRSDKGDYHEIWIDHRRGYDLCRECYNAFMRNILHLRWSDDEQDWVEGDES